MSDRTIKDVLFDLKNTEDCDYGTLDYFNILIKELELFAKVNNIDLDINITDYTNHNTKLVIDINE